MQYAADSCEMHMFDPDQIDNRNDRLMRATAGVIHRVLRPYHRAEVRGLEHVPDGPALFVGNHNGATLSIDTFLFCTELYRQRGLEHVPHGLAHDLVVDLPVLNHLVCQWGGVRASHENARRLFERGRKIMVYPGGDAEATRPHRRRNEVDFYGRTGFARLAIANEVPIVPVVAHGAHNTLFIVHDFPGLARALGVDRRFRYSTWPLAVLAPWGVWFGPTPPYLPFPARITVEVLEPVEVTGGAAAAQDDEYVADVAGVVQARLQQALTRLARGG